MSNDELLYAITDVIINEIGTDTTTTSQLSWFGQSLYKPGYFLGVFPADAEIPRANSRAFYIQNTEPLSNGAGLSGQHWLGVAIEPGHPPLLFDSYGRVPSRGWMPELQYMDTSDPDVNQRRDTKICGQLCLAFGKIFELHGRDVAATV